MAVSSGCCGASWCRLICLRSSLSENSWGGYHRFSAKLRSLLTKSGTTQETANSAYLILSQGWIWTFSIHDCTWPVLDTPFYLWGHCSCQTNGIPCLDCKTYWHHNAIMPTTHSHSISLRPPPSSDSLGGQWLVPSFDCHSSIKCLTTFQGAPQNHLMKSQGGENHG